MVAHTEAWEEMGREKMEARGEAPAILLGCDALVLWTGKRGFEFEWLLLGSWKPNQGRMIAQRVWPARMG